MRDRQNAAGNRAADYREWRVIRQTTAPEQDFVFNFSREARRLFFPDKGGQGAREGI
jgi:hypothetical protein